MSLDFVILGSNGRPEHTVALDVDRHHELTTIANKLDIGVLRAVSNYYEDAVIGTADLPALQDALVQIRGESVSDELKQVLSGLASLISLAITSQNDLHVLAD